MLNHFSLCLYFNCTYVHVHCGNWTRLDCLV